MSTVPAIRMEGAEQVTAALDRLRSYRLMGEKQLRQILQLHVRTIRRHVSSDAQRKMKSDPRKAAQAVKAMVYKSVIGFNVNLFGRKGGGGGGSVMVQMSGDLSGRGGNRRRRSQRTNAVDSYVGQDRGFVLRWIETGTQDRAVKFTADERRQHIHRGSQGGTKYGKASTINTGNRGKIAPRPFFGEAAGKAILEEAQSIRDDIMQLIEEVWAEEIKD